MFYILAIIGFLLIFTLVNKFNQGLINRSVRKYQHDNQMPELAEKLGLKYESQTEETPEQGSKSILKIGDRVYGEYREVQLEILFKASTQHMDFQELKGPYTHGYLHDYQRSITFKISNPENKQFHILPIDKDIVAHDTGNQQFDEKLILVGDKIVPPDLLEYFAALGWMDLTLKGEKLRLNDSFYSQFHSPIKARKILKSIHPIWRTSPQNQKMDLVVVQGFIDKMIDFIKQAKLS